MTQPRRHPGGSGSSPPNLGIDERGTHAESGIQVPPVSTLVPCSASGSDLPSTSVDAESLPTSVNESVEHNIDVNPDNETIVTYREEKQPSTLSKHAHASPPVIPRREGSSTREQTKGDDIMALKDRALSSHASSVRGDHVAQAQVGTPSGDITLRHTMHEPTNTT